MHVYVQLCCNGKELWNHQPSSFCRIPEGTSHYLNDLLTKLLKKSPKERLSYGMWAQASKEVVVSFLILFTQLNSLSTISSGILQASLQVKCKPAWLDTHDLFLCIADPMLTFCPSQTVKSSPVPIKRQPNLPHTSPHSASPVIIPLAIP